MISRLNEIYFEGPSFILTINWSWRWISKYTLYEVYEFRLKSNLAEPIIDEIPHKCYSFVLRFDIILVLSQQSMCGLLHWLMKNSMRDVCGYLLVEARWRLNALVDFNTGPSEFPTQRPVTWSFGDFFDLRPNKWLNKQTWGWWFETQSRPLWRQCNVDEVTENIIPLHSNCAMRRHNMETQ